MWLFDDLPRVAVKGWRMITMGFYSTCMFGMFVILYFMSSGRGSDTKDTDDEAIKAERKRRRTRRPICHPISTIIDICKDITKPNTPWSPIVIIVSIVSFAYRAVDAQDATFDDAADFKQACPAGGRRTQIGAFVKLFAATVTTVGINGHLGSLAESRSWKRETVRAIEVILVPLATLFHFFALIFHDLSISSPFHAKSWHENTSIRYRLARLCSCRLSSDSPVQQPYVGVISPKHISFTPLPRSLKWYGRLFILIVLIGQYSQASILLTRRFLSQTAATVDLAMLLMVISGFTALVQSITITLLNREFTLASPLEPCVEKQCRLPPCISNKASLNLPNARTTFKILGWTLAGEPRFLLNQLAGGFLQMVIEGGNREPISKVYMQLLSVAFAWKGTINILVCIEGANALAKDDPKQENPEGRPILEDQREDHDDGVTERTIDPIPTDETTESQEPGEKQEQNWEIGQDGQPEPSSQTDLKMPTPARTKSGRQYPESSFSPSQASESSTATITGLQTSSSSTLSSKFAAYRPSSSIFVWSFFFLIGVTAALVGIFCIVVQLVYLLFPFVILHMSIIFETAKWKDWDENVPCPILWKDGLEDLLWWF